MKKNLIKLAAVAIAALTMASCATINSGAAISTNAPIGSKMGEAQSTIILGLWSSQGEQNNIKQAAANGGITKISHVEYIDQSIIGGIVIKHTTRVFGE